MEHEVKCHPKFFKQMILGLKTHDTRFHDRDYTVGDTILECEYDPKLLYYTGRTLRVVITYIFKSTDAVGLNFNIPDNVCTMSIKLLDVNNTIK